MKYPQPALTPFQQSVAMKKAFPQFTFRYERGIPVWRGTLQPTDDSPNYAVKVCYREHTTPKVWVTEPQLRPQAPHCYKGGSLCLFYPKDGSWKPTLTLADTFIPWTALWLVFYEYWVWTGEWYGPSVPHGQDK